MRKEIFTRVHVGKAVWRTYNYEFRIDLESHHDNHKVEDFIYFLEKIGLFEVDGMRSGCWGPPGLNVSGVGDRGTVQFNLIFRDRGL